MKTSKTKKNNQKQQSGPFFVVFFRGWDIQVGEGILTHFQIFDKIFEEDEPWRPECIVQRVYRGTIPLVWSGARE